MGYKIVGTQTKKSYQAGEDYIICLPCDFSYDKVFKNILGYNVKAFEGCITKKRRPALVQGLTRLIDGLRKMNYSEFMEVGDVKVTLQDKVIREFEKLRDKVEAGEVKYIKVA